MTFESQHVQQLLAAMLRSLQAQEVSLYNLIQSTVIQSSSHLVTAGLRLPLPQRVSEHAPQGAARSLGRRRRSPSVFGRSPDGNTAILQNERPNRTKHGHKLFRTMLSVTQLYLSLLCCQNKAYFRSTQGCLGHCFTIAFKPDKLCSLFQD